MSGWDGSRRDRRSIGMKVGAALLALFGAEVSRVQTPAKSGSSDATVTVSEVRDAGFDRMEEAARDMDVERIGVTFRDDAVSSRGRTAKRPGRRQLPPPTGPVGRQGPGDGETPLLDAKPATEGRQQPRNATVSSPLPAFAHATAGGGRTQLKA